MWLGGVFVTKSDVDFSDVAIYCEPTGVFGIIPYKVYTCELCTFPICSDFVVFLEGIE